MKKYLMFFSALAIMATACQEMEVSPELTLNTPAEMTVETDGGIMSVGFTTNVNWTASIDNSSWSVTPTSGAAGTANLKVTALPNESDDPVTATLTIKAETLTQTVKFTQLQKDCLSLTADEAEVSGDGQTLEIEVLANVVYTVTPDVDWIKVVGTKGATATTATVEVEANTGDAREGHITFSGAGKKAEFTVKQGAFEPYFTIEGTDEWNYLYAPKAGKTVSFQVKTNLDYTYKTYEDSSFPWHHVTVAEDGTFTVVVDANKNYDGRTSYIKFTIPYIQDDVLDDNGEPTGETTDHVERVYIEQEGSLTTSWRKEFTWDLYNESHRYSMATAGDKLLVSTGLGIKVYSKADGSFLTNVELPFVPSGITNDDKGNVVLSTGGNYPLAEGEAYVPLQVWALAADKIDDLTAAKKVVEYMNGFYGYGLDNVRVTGDIFGDAVITMMSAGGWDGGSIIVSWEVKNGAVAADADGITPYTDYVSLPWSTAIWSSANVVAKHLGTTVGSGVFAIGYDGNYNLHYNPTMAGANWKEVLTTGSSWAEGYNAIDFIEWNGHKYASFIGMTYFGKVDWGTMPSYLWLVNIDDPENPVAVSTMEYYIDDENFVYGSTTDVCLEVEGDNLVAYVFDSGVSCYFKVVYPKL